MSDWAFIARAILKTIEMLMICVTAVTVVAILKGKI